MRRTLQKSSELIYGACLAHVQYIRSRSCYYGIIWCGLRPLGLFNSHSTV